MNVTLNLSLTQSHIGAVTTIAPAEHADRSPRERRLSGAAGQQAPSALVVSGSDEDRYLLSRLLERQNFAVYDARSGQQASIFTSSSVPTSCCSTL